MLSPEFWAQLDAHCIESKDRFFRNWEWQNSGIFGYASGFGISVEAFKDTIESTLEGHDLEERVGLDLAGGSQGLAILQLIQQGVIGKGLTVDHQVYKTRDMNEPNAHLVSADLTTEDGWRAIFDWKDVHAPKGFPLILHRPGDALQSFPAESYTGFLELCLDLMASGGVLISQLPKGLMREPDKFPVAPMKDESILKLEICMGKNPRISAFSINCLPTAGMPWLKVEKAG